MKSKTQTKQIVVNVSNESKTRINELKEQLELTDKEFITVLLNIFADAKEEDIKTVVEKFTIEKQKAKIEARLARIQVQLEKAKGELNEVESPTETPTETSDDEEEVVYSAVDEVEA